MRKLFESFVAIVVALIGAAWERAGNVVDLIVSLLGLAGIPDDLATWRKWLTMYDVNNWGPWILVVGGLISLIYINYGLITRMLRVISSVAPSLRDRAPSKSTTVASVKMAEPQGAPSAPLPEPRRARSGSRPPSGETVKADASDPPPHRGYLDESGEGRRRQLDLDKAELATFVRELVLPAFDRAHEVVAAVTATVEVAQGLPPGVAESFSDQANGSYLPFFERSTLRELDDEESLEKSKITEVQSFIADEIIKYNNHMTAVHKMAYIVGATLDLDRARYQDWRRADFAMTERLKSLSKQSRFAELGFRFPMGWGVSERLKWSERADAIRANAPSGR